MTDKKFVSVQSGKRCRFINIHTNALTKAEVIGLMGLRLFRVLAVLNGEQFKFEGREKVVTL